MTARWIATGSLLVITFLAAACSGTPSVQLTPSWPERPGDYEDVYRAWTRNDGIRHGFQQTLEVYATFRSPAWRAAFVDHRAAVENLSPTAREGMKAEQIKAAAEGPYEVYLMVTTYDHRQNDLNRGENSIWRLALVDDRGNEVEPIEVVRDRRPREVVQAEYPDMGDFAVAYTARFPRSVEVLRPGAGKFSLKMSSARGAVEMVWSAR